MKIENEILLVRKSSILCGGGGAIGTTMEEGAVTSWMI